MKLIFQTQIQFCQQLTVSINPRLIHSSSQIVGLSFIIRNGKVFQNRHGRAGSLRRVLIDAPDLAVPQKILLSDNGDAVYHNIAGINGDTAANYVQHGGLSRTVASHHCHKVTILYSQGKILEQTQLVDRAGIVIFMDVL